jgi:hypothetical protein
MLDARGAAVTLLLVAAPVALAAAQVSVRVEFAPGGECRVEVGGASGRARVNYPRRTAELRCAVPALAGPVGPDGVEVTVLLPPGWRRPSGEFPRMQWTLAEGRWVGRARVPATPAFVRIPPGGAWAGLRARALDVAVVAAALLAVVWAVVRERVR